MAYVLMRRDNKPLCDNILAAISPSVYEMKSLARVTIDFEVEFTYLHQTGGYVVLKGDQAVADILSIH